MRSISQTTWLRMLFALTAVGVVGGPGVVLAGNLNTGYHKPVYISIVGPERVPVATSQPYTLNVVYTDGSNSSATYPEAVFTVRSGPGSFIANYFSSPTIGVATIEGRLRSSSDVRLVASKRIAVSPRRVPGSGTNDLPVNGGTPPVNE